jgi:serine/threonine protein kinase
MSETEIGIFKQILQGKLDFESEPWPSISDSAKDLIRKMLERNPKKRLTAHEVLCKTFQFSLNRDLGVLGLNKFQHSDY